MLSKIQRIRNLGLVFDDFSWPAALPAFKSVNLIYGWNGCGKTTLTRLFDEIESPSAGNVQFELEDDASNRFSNGSAFPSPIRVFNQDYIQNNVRILESNANTISILLGEQNKELSGQIEADERELNGDPTDPDKVGKIRELHGYEQKLQRKETGNEKAFSDIARTIGAAIAGSGAASRTYRSPDAKNDFAATGAPGFLSDEELSNTLLTLKQDPLDTLYVVAMPNIEIDGLMENPIETASQCSTAVRSICSTTVEAELIMRLAENPDIASWVEEGVRLHASHRSVNCEYCGNLVSQERLASLARHFSEADRQLKDRIERTLRTLGQLYSSVRRVTVPDEARFYPELRNQLYASLRLLSKAKQGIETQIAESQALLQDKRGKTGIAVTTHATIDTSGLVLALERINAVIAAHNTKSREFDALKTDAIRRIKTHYLSTIFDEVTLRTNEIAELKPDLERRRTEIVTLQSRIVSSRAKISSAHKACEQINSGLTTFLGRSELRFEAETAAADDGTGGRHEAVAGYRIKRGDRPATYLSEGEKTAIAFVYFVVHLNDGLFPKAQGIVVVDDPVSSFDSNSLYQAFSFLKNAVSTSSQVFVLTHNYDFLKLLLNWRGGGRKKHTGFYMIKNQLVNNRRRATLDSLDPLLQNYESEYQYLFALLRQMQAEQDGSLMKAYPVPNVARKVWESFLMYCIPSNETPYRKMEALKERGFDAQKMDAIYKFTNDQSHLTGGGFDPALVPETGKVLTALFEMMKAVAPEHYAVLNKLVQAT